jgi:hypothetical protein
MAGLEHTVYRRLLPNGRHLAELDEEPWLHASGDTLLDIRADAASAVTDERHGFVEVGGKAIESRRECIDFALVADIERRAVLTLNVVHGLDRARRA